MSDEVTNFLRSVEQLKDRRLEEDEARSRELEEKILQEKRERQARRAERARSISPQKSSPANTPPPSSHHRYNSSQASDVAAQLPSSPPVLGSPRSPTSSRAPLHTSPSPFGSAGLALAGDTATPATPAFSSAFSPSSSPTKENESPFDADVKTPTNNPGLARTPTLSWQRRPASISLSASDRPKIRPLSMVAAENAAARSSIANVSPHASASPSEPKQEPAVSRDEIAQSLSAKDPSWFRQTPDRGLNSAAYRRAQVEDNDRQDLTSASPQLPGLSRSPVIEAGTSRHSPVASSPSLPPGSAKLGPLSPLSHPLTPTQRLDPPLDSIVSPPLSGRSSPTRPLSPTKGVGGFVQSAMLKRSDSVKRWSVTSPGGLQRGDSIASGRGGFDGARRTGTSHPPSSSRPTSSHGQDPSNSSRSPAVSTPTPAPTGASTAEHAGDIEEKKTTPPSSPSKTMDPRRWSPTKSSSWLEAALNKPDSSKPKTTAPLNNQPAWMVELNKAKAQKGSGLGSPEVAQAPLVARKHEVKTGGLMRSTPMGTTAGVTSPTPGPIGLGTRPGPSASISSTSGRPALASYHIPPESASESIKAASGINHTPSPSVSSNSGKAMAPESPSLASTPPNKDFRANLKPRQPLPSETDKSQTDELQGVFGKLRRTKTQNFVAPDILKDNILRGKSALNVTGGPKPRERKDEFKEAILQKKASFHQAKSEGRGITTNARDRDETQPIPEGVAKRLEMSRTGGARSASPSHRTQSVSEGSSSAAPRPLEAVDFNRPGIASSFPKRDFAGTATAVPEKEGAAPVVQAAGVSNRIPRMGSAGGLASRFNPALAGLLARGPPGSAPHGAAPSTSGATPSSSASAADTPPGPGPQLTHMTKNRARGPRRKAPTSLAKPTANPEPVGQPQASQEAAKAFALSKKSPPAIAPKKRDITPKIVPLVDSSKKAEAPELNPSKAPTTRPRSPTKIHEQVAAIAARSQQAKPAETKVDESPAVSPRKLDVKRMSKFLDESSSQVAALVPRPLSPQKTGGNARPLPEAPASPTKEWKASSAKAAPLVSPTLRKSQTSPVPVLSPASPASPASSHRSNTFSDRLRLSAQAKPQSPTGTRPLEPTSPAISPRHHEPTSPALPSPGLPSPVLSSPMRSPSKHAQEVSVMLRDFFGPDRPSRNYRADAAEILSKRARADTKVNTVRTQLWLVTSDGKKQPVPSHYERTLFEQEMYICTHTFSNEAGWKSTEVYFWVGDEVPEAMVEDAQVFLGREARSLGGKLVQLRQGKETAEFLQALGGAVTIRRGSSTKFDSLASSMFCGRRFLGQITFDEVDFAPTGLCSGFPYLITQQGKCYLWKGKGSHIDELGCARLLGMDMALTGELIEVDDGQEPADFWALFGSSSSRAGSADHWRLKPKYERYCGRLFRSEAHGREQIVEIHPFDQQDLSPDGIYILDAFFEMYIVVGHRSQDQYASFHNALEFAQEYAILAAGMEDRPFVPISTVVLEGIPRDLRSVFRKWCDAASPTRTAVPSAATLSPQPIKRGRSLRIVPLTVALQALAD